MTSNETVEMAPRRRTEETRDCICTESNLHVSCTERYTGIVKTSKTESKQCAKSCMPACQATACILWVSKRLHVTFEFLLPRYVSLIIRKSRCKFLGMGHSVKFSFVFNGILTNWHIPGYSNRRPRQSFEPNPHRECVDFYQKKCA